MVVARTNTVISTMKMNRRNVLVGLGTIVASGGAALGTGAFSSVEADRTVNLQTSGDSSALLQLDPAGTQNVASQTGDTLEFDQHSVNENARTEFQPGFTITNNGDNSVGVYIDDSPIDVGTDGILEFEDSNGQSITTNNPTSDAPEILQLEADGGADSENINVIIDLTNDAKNGTDLENITEITIYAEDDLNP